MELGVSELEGPCSDQGILAYADLAFAVSDAQSTEKIEAELIKPICKDEKKHFTKVRRLYAHAYAVTSAETERFSANVAEPIVRLHPAECESRRSVLAKRHRLRA